MELRMNYWILVKNFYRGLGQRPKVYPLHLLAEEGGNFSIVSTHMLNLQKVCPLFLANRCWLFYMRLFLMILVTIKVLFHKRRSNFIRENLFYFLKN